jgi:hypothetical protein
MQIRMLSVPVPHITGIGHPVDPVEIRKHKFQFQF